MAKKTSSRRVLVTGATGKQGGAVARELLFRGFSVRALTRKPDSEAAKELAHEGAEVVKGDLNDPDSLRQALKGMWGAFAVQTSMEAGVQAEEDQGMRFAQLAQKAGIKHFVYTSVGCADKKTGIPHFENKWRIEELIRSLGFASHVILRPVFFMDNFLSPWFWPGIEQGKLSLPLQPTTRLQMVAVADIGKFGGLAFEKHAELNGSEIDLAGDEKDMLETAEILSEALGRKIEYVPLPLDEFRRKNPEMGAMYEWFEKTGYNVNVQALTREYGIWPMTLREWAAYVRWPQHA